MVSIKGLGLGRRGGKLPFSKHSEAEDAPESQGELPCAGGRNRRVPGCPAVCPEGQLLPASLPTAEARNGTESGVIFSLLSSQSPVCMTGYIGRFRIDLFLFISL